MRRCYCHRRARTRRWRYDAAASQHRIATVAATTTLSWHSVGATTIISRPSKTTYLQASLIRYNPEKGDHFFDDLLRTSSSSSRLTPIGLARCRLMKFAYLSYVYFPKKNFLVLPSLRPSSSSRVQSEFHSSKSTY